MSKPHRPRGHAREDFAARWRREAELDVERVRELFDPRTAGPRRRGAKRASPRRRR